MAAGGGKATPAIGFLTVLEHPQHGLFGGYLLLNAGGRPLEFHCTAPLKPTRAQQILYGPTLEPYLYGEQIGQTLIAKGSLEPLAICTDSLPMLAVRDHVGLPVAMVLGGDEPTDAKTPQFRIDAPHGARGAPFMLGKNRLTVASHHAGDTAQFMERLGKLDNLFDLAEPFGRIREAIEEAGRTSK